MSGERPSAGPWGGRPARFTADDVVRTALGLGVATFTVSRVAQSLGVSPASVQRHFPTRDDLLDECLRRICTLIPPVAVDAGWRETLETMVEGLWLMFTRYPGLDAVWQTYTRPLETVGHDSLTLYAHLAAQGFSVRQSAFAGYCTTRLTSTGTGRNRSVRSSNHGEPRHSETPQCRPFRNSAVLRSKHAV